MSDPILINITTGDLLPLLGATLPSGVTGSLSLSLNLSVEVPEVPPVDPPPPTDTTDAMGLKRFIMATFRTDSEKPYIYHSDDCDAWSELTPSPDTYNWWSTRDPNYVWHATLNRHLLLHTDGQLGASGTFSIAESTPTTNGAFAWSKRVSPPCTIYNAAGVDKVWAPKRAMISDPLLHVLVSIADVNNGPPYARPFYPHYLYPTSSDLLQWSTPVRITGTAIPGDAIDFNIIECDGLFYLSGTDCSTHLSFVAVSTSPFSGFDTLIRSGDWMGIDKHEGLCFVKFADHWRIYSDPFPKLVSQANPNPPTTLQFVKTSSLNLATCTIGLVQEVSVPLCRHGSIVDRLAA